MENKQLSNYLDKKLLQFNRGRNAISIGRIIINHLNEMDSDIPQLKLSKFQIQQTGRKLESIRASLSSYMRKHPELPYRVFTKYVKKEIGENYLLITKYPNEYLSKES